MLQLCSNERVSTASAVRLLAQPTGYDTWMPNLQHQTGERYRSCCCEAAWTEEDWCGGEDTPAEGNTEHTHNTVWWGHEHAAGGNR